MNIIFQGIFIESKLRKLIIQLNIILFETYMRIFNVIIFL